MANYPVKSEDFGEIVVGNVLQAGAGAMTARIAQRMAGISEKVPCSVVNRFCSSGLEACAIIAAKIKAGFIDTGIGAGVENMSINAMQDIVDANALSDETFDSVEGRSCLVNMGNTSENVAKQFNITREMQDQFAFES